MMAQIYSQAALPLPERRSIFQSVEHFYPTKHETTVMPQYSDLSLAENRFLSKNQSSMSASKNIPFELTTPKVGGEDYRVRKDLGQKQESLPPLSSIFSGSSQHLSLGFSVTHSSQNQKYFPPDPRRPSIAFHCNDSSLNLSSLGKTPPPLPPPTPSLSPNESIGVNPIRLGYPQPPRSVTPSTTPRAKSPSFDSRQNTVENHGSLTSYSGGNWSPPQSTHVDHVSGAMPIPFMTSTDHLSSPKIRPEQEKTKLHESQPSTQFNYALTSISSDHQPTTKDGLGPKIWTGTHFLPRFVRQAEVPGEGICYFYDDGTHCKSVIDGEMVNAHWGVTKTGKPRKRLAIACITCREKKIKCDPDYPRCIQCEKFGRICRFKNAPRGGHSSPATPPADSEELSTQISSAREEDTTREKRRNTSSVSPRQAIRHETPDSELNHLKRQRNGYFQYTPITLDHSPNIPTQDIPSPTPFTEKMTSLLPDSNTIRQWHTNPYVSQPEIVTEFLSIFFQYVPETIHGIFPQGPFKKWALNPVEKSLDEYTTLYAILSLAAVFSPKPEQRTMGVYYAPIARLGCENRPFTLALVQSRLLLSMFYLTQNQTELAWDLCGSAMRAATALQLNQEMDKSDDVHRHEFPYGLNRAGYAECRRRTFWSSYLIDKFSGFCAGYLSVFKSEDVFLRLPCDSDSYDCLTESNAPFFDHTTPAHTGNSNRDIGCLGYLIKIATIWSDVLANIYRSSQRAQPTSLANFTKFYEESTHRMRDWEVSLPTCLRFTSENFQRAAHFGNLGTMITMHAVYHNTGMKLNRYVPHYILTPLQVTHHLDVANQHAEAVLMIMDTLHTKCQYQQTSTTLYDRLPPKFLSPFVGYCIVSAVDILTAKLSVNSISSRMASFQGSQAILSELSLFWPCLTKLVAQVQQRLMRGSPNSSIPSGGMRRNVGSRSDDGLCRSFEPLEKMFSREDDCVYQ